MKLDQILLITDDNLSKDFIADGLREKSYRVDVESDGEKALQILRSKDKMVVVLDLGLKKQLGFALYQEIKRIFPDLPIILLAQAKQSLDPTVALCLEKPVCIAKLDDLIKKASKLALASEFSMIAESPSMQKILKDVEKLAKTSSSIFISGESGTGKEVIAKAIHTFSDRKNAPFIRVNCAALPETLIESELFGHEKGSFTGAHARRLGRFELAHNGTLLLDEVTEIPLTLQSKLLRAIQEQEFERIGGMKSLKVDVRLIATSNRDMRAAIEEKLFREDLYYRLNVLPIHLPPLRERPEDILPLANYFLNEVKSKNRNLQKILSSDAKTKLYTYNWPGNIRELGNVIEHAAIMSSGDEIKADDLILEHRPKSCPVQILGEMQKQMTIREMELWLIKQTLEAHNGNRTKSAKALGISIRTLRNKINLYPELK